MAIAETMVTLPRSYGITISHLFLQTFLQIPQTFHTFSKEHYNHNTWHEKLLAECHPSNKRKNYCEIFMCQKNE